MRYNIVLQPAQPEVSQAIISLANDIVSQCDIKPIYLLQETEKKSLPHISVIQFECAKPKLLEQIWDVVLDQWNDIITLTDISKIRYKQDHNGPFAGICWAEIAIDKTKNPDLQLFHETLCDALEPLDVTAINASRENYRPHLTLFNTAMDTLKYNQLPEEFSITYQEKIGNFSLFPALGVANAQWELIATPYCLHAQAETLSEGSQEEIPDAKLVEKLKTFFADMSPDEFFKQLEADVTAAEEELHGSAIAYANR